MRYKGIIYLVLVLSLIGNGKLIYNHFKYEQPATRPFVHLYNRQEIFSEMPIDSNGIIMLGDSHTQFFPLDELFRGYDIVNRGIMSDRTDQIFGRLDQIIIYKPRQIFLQAGINDIIQGIDTSIILQNFKEIVLKLRNCLPTTQLIIQSIFPVKNKKVSEKANAANKILKAFCEENKLLWIDVYGRLEDSKTLANEYDCGDGLHLNGKGYLLWKELITPFIIKKSP